MTTTCDLPIDLSTKSHHQHHHHPHHHHHLGHGHHHHHHLLASVHNSAHHHHHHHHLDHHHLNQLHDAEELAFQQLQLEYLSHQQLCAAFANHPLNRLYAAASHHHNHHHEQQQQQQQQSPPHNHHQQFDQLTINTWSPPAHQLSQHLSLNSHHHHQQAALCLNQSVTATAVAAAAAASTASATGIIERTRPNDANSVAAKFYERHNGERDFGKRLDENSDDEQLRKRSATDDETTNCEHSHNTNVVACLERRHEREATSIIEENPSPIDLHRSSTSSTHSNASSPSSSSASITSTSSSSHSSSTFLGGNHLQSGDKKRINRPLTGKHVKHGTGASVRTLVALRKVIRQRQQLSAK